MTESGKMLSVNSAQEEILRRVERLGYEKASIFEAAGRVLRESIRSPHDVPPFRNSAMDGYAVISDDTLHSTQTGPARLLIVEEIPAGASPKFRLERGNAAAIMTGAPLPCGADSVVKIEETRREGDSVLILRPAEKHENVREKGEDVKAGEEVLTEGMVLTPARTGMLAQLDRSSCVVTKRLRVSIVVTGDEVFEPHEPMPPGGIRNSNGYSLFAGVKETGALPVYVGIARDDEQETREKLSMAFELGDVVVTSGGVSVGRYDLVKKVLSEFGELVFEQVRMQPGKPTVFGMRNGKPFFGLPGNPVSVIVAFEQFVRPAIMKMLGMSGIFRPAVIATLTEKIRKPAGRMQFLRGRLTRKDDGFLVATTGPQGSGILKSLVNADGLIRVPEDETFLPAGAQVEVQLLSEGSVYPGLEISSKNHVEGSAWKR